MTNDELRALADALLPMAAAPGFDGLDIPTFVAWLRQCAEQRSVWVVFDGDDPIYVSTYPQACHEHINSAISDFGISDAGQWVVRQFAFPQPDSDAALYRARARVADWLAKEQPAQPQPEPSAAQIEAALRRAFELGKTYWAQADSESWSENKRSDKTLERFRALVAEFAAKEQK